jgi:hypothetical protein
MTPGAWLDAAISGAQMIGGPGQVNYVGLYFSLSCPLAFDHNSSIHWIIVGQHH